MPLKTQPFRDQHDKILEIAGKISRFIVDSHELTANSNNVSKLLTDLSRTLQVHLTLEDTSLYPIICMTDNTGMKELAVKYKTEMGDIKKLCTEYFNRWQSGFKIEKNPLEFIRETNDLFNSLIKRIELENNELYRRIDELFK